MIIPAGRKPSQTTGAVLVAAGSGRRFGGRKQFRRLGKQVLYQYSLEVLLAHPRIFEIAVVVPEDSVEEIRREVNARNDEKPVSVVPGGEKRQDSVLQGIKALSTTPDLVCIHDAARPFLTPEYIDRCLDACARYPGAITAVPSSDTVKQVAVNSPVITATLPRETIWLAQTPQVFVREFIQSLLMEAEKSGETVTDEASLMETSGYEVSVVEGSPVNRKITSREDWLWAESWINRKEDADGL